MYSNIDLLVNNYVGEKLTSLQSDMPIIKKNYSWAHEQVMNVLDNDIKFIADFFQQTRNRRDDKTIELAKRHRLARNICYANMGAVRYTAFQNIYSTLDNIALFSGFLIEDIKDMCPELIEPYKEILNKEQINAAVLDFYIARLDDAIVGYVASFDSDEFIIDALQNKDFETAIEPIKTLLELVNSDQLKQHEFYKELKRHFEIQERFRQNN